MVTAIELFGPTNVRALWIVIEWNYLLLILLYFSVQVTNLLHRNDKFGTVRNKCSIIPLSSSLHFATLVRKLRVVRLSWSSRFVMLAAASILRGTNSSDVSTFILYTSLFIQTHKQKSSGFRSGDWNSSISATFHNQTHVHFLFSCNDRYYYLPKYWLFLLNHPLYIIKSHAIFLLLTSFQKICAGPRMFIPFR